MSFADCLEREKAVASCVGRLGQVDMEWDGSDWRERELAVAVCYREEMSGPCHLVWLLVPGAEHTADVPYLFHEVVWL